MKNLMKISRENLKSLNGGAAGPMCPDDPAFMICYSLPPNPNGICMTRYKCCMALGNPQEECKQW